MFDGNLLRKLFKNPIQLKPPFKPFMGMTFPVDLTPTAFETRPRELVAVNLVGSPQAMLIAGTNVLKAKPEVNCAIRTVGDHSVSTFLHLENNPLGFFIIAPEVDVHMNVGKPVDIFKYDPCVNHQTQVFEVSSGLMKRSSDIFIDVHAPSISCAVIRLASVDCELPEETTIIATNKQGGVIPCFYEVTDEGISICFEPLALYTAHDIHIHITNPYVNASHAIRADYIHNGFTYIVA